MAGTLEILCNFSLLTQGRTVKGKQGEADSAFLTPYELSVDGKFHEVITTLATATAMTAWDDDSHFPADFDFLFFWADQDTYLQLIASATNVVLTMKAYIPFIASYDTLLAAASTTAISGSAPSVTDIDSVVIQNNSGSTANVHLCLVD